MATRGLSALVALTTTAAVMAAGIPAYAQVGNVIGLGIGAIVGRELGKEAARKRPPTFEEKAAYIRDHRDMMDGVLNGVVAKMVKGLPRAVSTDGETLDFTNVTRDGAVLNYVYAWREPSEPATAQEVAEAKAKSAPKLCANDDTRLLLMGGYHMAYWYYNPDGKTLVGSYSVSAADCR